MIVDPDFLDHWRTRMVVDALGGDEMAPMYIMRLWAHCQNRKSDTFAIPAAGIKAMCKFPGDAALLEKALIDAEFIVRDGVNVTVVGWAERNASLLAAWENGGKGGRPKKPNENPAVTHGKPSGNPAVTQTEPMGNPAVTDKIREEKIREEPPAAGAAAYEPEGFKTFWEEWPQSHRKGGRVICLKVWRDKRLELQACEILMHLKTMKVSRDWTKDSGDFIPAPVVYLRAAKWDGAELGKTPANRFAGAI